MDRAEQGKQRKGEPDKSTETQFFSGEKPAFDLDELYRSSAEIIGKGRLGITYRVTLESGPVIVVKRLRNMSGVAKKAFVQNMQLLGKLRHDNIVGIISCHYSREEKLVTYEYIPGGSLFQLLHENRGEARMPLPWAARLAIAKGMARGLAYLHQCLPHHKLPHGNLKSSNVLILHDQKQHYHPKLTDHGFQPLLPHVHKLAVSKCPEVSHGRRLSHKADVFCFGLVLLEVVTGKVPVEDDGDLSQWARLALSHEWSTDILDVEIVAEKDKHADMLRLTEIALECTALRPEKRPRMADIVRMIDEIKEGRGGREDSLTEM